MPIIEKAFRALSTTSEEEEEAVVDIEQRLWARQVQRLVGVDEAGRGALAGPVVAAAVMLPSHCVLSPLVRDSKTLSGRQRLKALEEIQRVALAIGVGMADAAEVDRWNVRQAARLAMKRAVMALPVTPDYLLVDAETVDVPVPQESLIKGDRKSAAIAAASVVAKVTRDALAEEWDEQYPQYGFAQHKGYATAQHRAALRRWGPTPLHRKTFVLRENASHVPGQLELWLGGETGQATDAEPAAATERVRGTERAT